MANSLRFPNPLPLYGGQIFASGIDVNGNLVAPIVTSSNVMCDNLFAERALYCDSTGNIISGVLTILNDPSVDSVLIGLDPTTARWQSPNVITDAFTITNSPSVGQVLTGVTGNTAQWEAPGAIVGNISCSLVTANVASLGVITGTSLDLTGNLTAANIDITSNITTSSFLATDITVSTNATIGGVLSVTGNVNAVDAEFSHIHTDSVNVTNGAVVGGTLAVTGNVTGSHFTASGKFHGSIIAPLVTATNETVSGTLGVTGVSTLGTVNAGAITGSVSVSSPQLTSSVATGTAPLVISSTTRVSNLNAATCGTADITNGLKSATTTVSISSATAPSSGQALIATSSTAATWQTLPSVSTNVNVATYTLSSAEILSMGSTPVQVLAAPGAGYAINVIGMSIQSIRNTVAFTGGSAVVLLNDNGISNSYALGSAGIAATGIYATSSSGYCYVANVNSGNAASAGGSSNSGLTARENVGLLITTYSRANFSGGGNGTAKVTVFYTLTTIA